MDRNTEINTEDVDDEGAGTDGEEKIQVAIMKSQSMLDFNNKGAEGAGGEPDKKRGLSL